MDSDSVDRSPRPVVLVPYWEFFERSSDEDLRESRAGLLAELRGTLPPTLGDLAELWIDSAAAGERAATALRAAAPTALLVMQTMAVPPAWTTTVLDSLPSAPVLLVVAQRRLPPGQRFDHGAIVDHGAAVGAAQLANALVRRGRTFRIVAGEFGDPATGSRVAAEASAAHAAGRLRRARLLRLGAPIDGYECVDCDAAELAAATGISLVERPPEDLRRAYLEVDSKEVAALSQVVERDWEVAADARDTSVFERSMRMAVAIERLGRGHEADGGALNCHVEQIRLGPEPGIAPCFALGRETTAGRPWTCTGDVVTAVAMLTLKLLGAPAWYHEIEAIDEDREEALLACSGEHDLGIAPSGKRPQLRRNPWWEGVCACFTPPPGAATLVAFTPGPGAAGGFRFVVAEGSFTDRSLAETGTVNGAFSFADAPPWEAWERWIGAGANHHAAATLGHRAGAVAAVAAHLGVDCIVV